MEHVKSVKELVKEYGNQTNLANVLGTSQSQVSRWLISNAHINTKTGEVWIVSTAKRVNSIWELKNARVD